MLVLYERRAEEDEGIRGTRDMVVGPLFGMCGAAGRTFSGRNRKEHRFEGSFNDRRRVIESYGCYVWCKSKALRRRRLNR